jgi:mRNA interferase RelE/StbE
MYKILFTAKARNQINNLPRPVAKRIVEKIQGLADDPFSRDIKKLVDMPFYRLRVGDYRVIFDLKMDELVILIVKVGQRSSIYK